MSLDDSCMYIKCHVRFVTTLRLHEIRELIMGITRRETNGKHRHDILIITYRLKLYFTCNLRVIS